MKACLKRRRKQKKGSRGIAIRLPRRQLVFTLWGNVIRTFEFDLIGLHVEMMTMTSEILSHKLTKRNFMKEPVNI